MQEAEQLVAFNIREFNTLLLPSHLLLSPFGLDHELDRWLINRNALFTVVPANLSVEGWLPYRRHLVSVSSHSSWGLFCKTSLMT
jgi:hypothetical protein